MTRNYEMKTRPESQYEVCTWLPCNKCAKQAPNPNGFDDEIWSTAGYEYNGVIIQRVTGEHFPEGGWKKVLTWDICPECFEQKIVPLLGEPYEKEHDF